MRLLGIDLGTKTMGLAITDSLQIIANGLENFYYSNNDLNQCVNKINTLIEYYKNDIDKIILGYPLNISGSKSERTILIEKFKDLLIKSIPSSIKIVLQDERYTTNKATEILKFNNKLKSSKIKKIKDKMSAVIILEEYMGVI